MKTKTVVLTGWVPRSWEKGWDNPNEHFLTLYRKPVGCIPATLTIEVPVQEKTRTISESDLERAADEYAHSPVKLEALGEFLKQKLFGEGES